MVNLPQINTNSDQLQDAEHVGKRLPNVPIAIHEKFSLLLVDDEPSAVSVLKRFFRKEDYILHSAGNGESTLRLLGEVHIDAALIDLKMPGMDGLTLLGKIRKRYPAVMTMIITAHGGIREAVQAMELGAIDFFEKPSSPTHLRERMVQLHRVWRLRIERQERREKVDHTFNFDQLLGHSNPMLELKKLITQVGAGNASVLIQGESGTGKELVARAIHKHSLRAQKPCIPVDCASLNETMIETELFGHTKGAFTNAHTATTGLIRSADQGTLFFDEIGELPLAMQAKLLRTIQEREVRPVGSSKAYPVDIRILAATNRNLEETVKSGEFREDLYYRLNAVVIQTPSLYECRDDIPLLVQHFIARFKSASSPVTGISPEAVSYLQNYKWPGNIRELENVILRAMALGKEELIRPEDLPSTIFTSPLKKASDPFSPQGSSLEDYELAALLNALKISDNNRRLTAEILGIGESTLYRKLVKYKLNFRT